MRISRRYAAIIVILAGDGGDAVTEALRSLGHDVSGMALRNAATVTGLGVAFVALSRPEVYRPRSRRP